MLNLFKIRGEKGDTLIEVLFAFSILSLIIVGSISVMNQGTQAAQRALETTLASQQIEAQATTLRFLHDAYLAQYQPGATYDPATPAGQWKAISDRLTLYPSANATDFIGAATCPSFPSGSFILDSANATVAGYQSGKIGSAPVIAQVLYTGSPEVLDKSEGIWIEGIRSPAVANENVGYIDFHIMACWQTPGKGLPQTIGTIVRLNEPRG